MENYHSDNNRRPAGQGAGEALGEAYAEGVQISLIVIALNAYKNHKARTGNTGDAMYQAALTTRRWWVWYIALLPLGIMSLVMWWGLFYVHYLIPHNDYMINRQPHTGTFAFGAASVLAYTVAWSIMWTIYCRNIDSGMLRRRVIYRLFQPLYKATMKVPSFFLYAAIPAVLLFLPLPFSRTY